MANNTSYKPNEGKREEFRRYLEKTGVMDALTKVLVLLYEEADKPEDALAFILNALSRQTGAETTDDLKAQVVELKERIAQLEADNKHLSESAVVQPAEKQRSSLKPADDEVAEEVKEEDKPEISESVEEQSVA
ncbi:c-Myc-binding protein homolog [Atheta coriaria]|uniref:c-Myc-binding protein homolog n=1 Tax=Dalotia coriaria TaxID=877792 RepID=UPI0031F441CC